MTRCCVLLSLLSGLAVELGEQALFALLWVLAVDWLSVALLVFPAGGYVGARLFVMV